MLQKSWLYVVEKSHPKTSYATMPCDLTIYKVAVNFFLLSQVRDDQNLCCIFLSHRKIEVQSGNINNNLIQMRKGGTKLMSPQYNQLIIYSFLPNDDIPQKISQKEGRRNKSMDVHFMYVNHFRRTYIYINSQIKKPNEAFIS